MDYFLKKHAEIMKRTPPCLDNKVIQVMMDYQWPGNIRELESFARRIVVFGDVQMATDELRSLSIGGTISAPVAEGTPLRIAAQGSFKTNRTSTDSASPGAYSLEPKARGCAT